jgi:uncharacterized membrane protein
MSHWKSFGLAIFAAGCLLNETTDPAHAQCNPCATEWSGGSVIELPSLPGATDSVALGINDMGQAVGQSLVGGVTYATEWSDGSVIELPGLPSATDSVALGINDAGEAVGQSLVGGVEGFAVEWSDGSVIDLGDPRERCHRHQ